MSCDSSFYHCGIFNVNLLYVSQVILKIYIVYMIEYADNKRSAITNIKQYLLMVAVSHSAIHMQSHNLLSTTV